MKMPAPLQSDLPPATLPILPPERALEAWLQEHRLGSVRVTHIDGQLSLEGFVPDYEHKRSLERLARESGLCVINHLRIASPSFD